MRNLIVRVPDNVKKGYTLESVGYTVTVKYAGNRLGEFRKRGKEFHAINRKDDMRVFSDQLSAFRFIKQKPSK